MNPQQAKLRRRERAALLALLLLLLKFKDGQISKSEFLADAVALLAAAYTDAVVIGAGESEPSPEQRVDPINTALEQRSYLAGLADDVSSNRYGPKTAGGQGSKALRSRVMLYILLMTGLANKAWAESKQKQAVEQGEPEPEGLWQVNDSHPCSDCDEEGAEGWRPLSQFTRWPGDGSTQCLANCLCSVQTRDGSSSFANV